MDQDIHVLLMCTSSDIPVHWVLPLLCFFGLRNFETIHHALCHHNSSHMLNEMFMKLSVLREPNMKMCTLVVHVYPGPLSFSRVMPVWTWKFDTIHHALCHHNSSHMLNVYKCRVLGITLEKLNGPGYGTNVYIFILWSCNILSFTNISLSMWEELWWQSAWWIVSNFQVQTGITLEKLNGPGYTCTTNVHIFGYPSPLSFTPVMLLWTEKFWDNSVCTLSS
jgi:hypothetical protein